MTSVGPALQLISGHLSVDVFHRTTATLSELTYHIDAYRALDRYSKTWYGILYLAYHGVDGAICLRGENDPLPLGALAARLGRTFSGFVFHFGSCSTINSPQGDLKRFMETTGAACLIGYSQDVDWMESTALDILILSRLIETDARNSGPFFRSFFRDYGDLSTRLALRIYPDHQ